MIPGRFVLSLDCEGKWGIADHLRSIDHVLLATDRLKKAYGDLIGLLDHFDISATFAVTGLFALSPKQLSELPLDIIEQRLPYCRQAVAAIRAGQFDGWHGEWLRDLIPTRHEWASHGITHTPYDQMNPETVLFEHELTPYSAGQTFVFPRNKVAHRDTLAALGYRGFRRRADNNAISRILSEFNIWAHSERDDPMDRSGMTAIPAGHFVNWKSGVRRIIPTIVSRRRAAHMLNHAARSGGVVHFWTHPENIASVPQTIEVLAAILKEVRDRVKMGDIVVQTQEQYIDHLTSAGCKHLP